MATTKKPLTKAQLISALAEQSDLPKKQVQALLELIADTAHKEAKAKEGGITLPGLGKLVLVRRKARMGRNPATGEAIKIPAKKVLKFRIAKACKDAVSGAK